MPIAFGLGLEIFHHETTIYAPSTQWWISLSSAIVFGLAFATALTLIVTPAALMVFSRSNDSNFYAYIRRIFRRGNKADASTPSTEPASPAVVFPKAAE